MNSKERIEAALGGRAVDRVPFCPFLAYVWEHFPKEIQDMGHLAFHDLVGADPMWRGAPCPIRTLDPVEMKVKTVEEAGRSITEIQTPVGTLKQVYARSEAGNTSFLVEHPLKKEEDYKIRMWIEENTRYEFDTTAVDAHFAGYGKMGLSLGMLIPRSKSAFQSLIEHHVGTEELAYALADFPETVEALLQVMVEKDIEAVRLAVESRYEYFITWEDSGTQNYSPTQYDRYIGSEIAQWCRILAGHKKHYIQHACGHVKELVSRMKASGVFAVESLSPPPTGNISLKQAREVIGSGMGIIGGIEPTNFLNLPLEKLAAYVEQVVSDGAGGPFVLANSDSCPPGVTVEKFRLVARTVSEL